MVDIKAIEEYYYRLTGTTTKVTSICENNVKVYYSGSWDYWSYDGMWRQIC